MRSAEQKKKILLGPQPLRVASKTREFRVEKACSVRGERVQAARPAPDKKRVGNGAAGARERASGEYWKAQQPDVISSVVSTTSNGSEL